MSVGISVENPRHGVLAEFTPAGVDFRAGENRWGTIQPTPVLIWRQR